MKKTTKRFTALAATALIAVSTIGAAAVTASAKSRTTIIPVEASSVTVSARTNARTNSRINARANSRINSRTNSFDPSNMGRATKNPTTQTKTPKVGMPFTFNAYGKTSYGYEYSYNAPNKNIVVVMNYNNKANRYEFSVFGKKACKAKVTLKWNVNDKKTESATFNLKVDKYGNVTVLNDEHAPSMRG